MSETTGQTAAGASRSSQTSAPGNAGRTVSASRSSGQFLAEASRDLNASLKLDDVFRRVAERVQVLIDYHLFCVMLWNERSELLEHSFSLCQGEHQQLQGGFPLGYGISGLAAQRREAVRVGDVTKEPNYVRVRHPEVEVCSELAVPLVLKNRLIGVLDLESMVPDAFTEEHEYVLTALASHIAIALDNARLYEQSVEGERRLERDLETAREVQKGLLPERAPGVAGLEIGTAYAPARELGGDFFDFLPYGAGRTAMAVGDVAGKSTPAALYASMAVGLLRGYGFQNRCGPGQMLRYLNDRLHLPRVGPRYLAMVFAVFDELDGMLTISNGGLPWPYIVRSGGVDKVPVAGMPLGFLDEFEYDEVSIVLEPGTIVAFCSDGLSEMQNARGEMFGDARMREVLSEQSARRASAQAMANALLTACTTHAGGRSRLSDDCTALVLKRTG